MTEDTCSIPTPEQHKYLEIREAAERAMLDKVFKAIDDVGNPDPALGTEIVLNGSNEMIDVTEAMLQETIKWSSRLGSAQMRIAMEREFVATLANSIDKGIGRLLDADMNEASPRLKALQTQEQLAIQSWSIANTSAENVIQLFR